MELEFDVKINTSVLYDYMLYHTYTSLSGILGSVVGVFLLFGYMRQGHFLYLAAGIFVLAYLPCVLWVKSAGQVKRTPAFQKPLHYRLDEEGVTVSQGETTQLLPWENVYKAISTKASIILYMSRMNAWIFPRKALGDNLPKALEIISTHMPPDKVKIRY